jgi:hypothetical protein
MGVCMRVYDSWRRASIIAAFTVLLSISAVLPATCGFTNAFDLSDVSVSSTDGPAWASPPASSQVSLGVDDDGKTLYVNKGDEIRFKFVEYGAEDSWKMRSNPNVKVVSDLVMESYPMQHALTVIMLAPTDIYFDRASAPGGGKTKLVYHITFYGNSILTPGTNNGGYVPDPTFDVPPVIIGSDNSEYKWITLADRPLSSPLAISNGAFASSPVDTAQVSFFDKVSLDVFNGRKISANLFRRK